MAAFFTVHVAEAARLTTDVDRNSAEFRYDIVRQIYRSDQFLLSRHGKTDFR